MQVPTPASKIDGTRFREVLGSYPTGVAIVSCMDENGMPVGMVIGSFTSVSLDPPLIAYLPMKSSRTFARMRGATTFCVNILAADQEVAFASISPPRSKTSLPAWPGTSALRATRCSTVSWAG